MVEPDVDHVILTRFNLPSGGIERSIRVREGWLESRVELFETYCLPSVAAQSAADLSWIVYFDPESPVWLKRRITLWQDGTPLTPVFRASVSADQLLEDVRRISGAGHARLLTTNLDNDDALAVDFAARVQAMEPEREATALYLAQGLIACGGLLYRRVDRANAFCSVSAPWREPKTCWADWHNLLGRGMPVRVDRRRPAWLQVVHGRNVSNRVHGVLTSPAAYADLFPGLLGSFAEPDLPARLRDAALEQPGRFLREAGRGLAKRVIVAAAGRGALDRVRLRIREGTGLGSLSGRGRET